MSIIKIISIVLCSFLFTGNAMGETTSKISESNINEEQRALGMYQEALDYLLGRNGKEKSPAKAAELFQALAEQNWSSAQHMLGNLYYKGKGVEKNDLLAYKWLSIATRNNVQLAEAIYDKRKLLKSKLSNNHLQQAENWIADWQPSQ